MFVEIATLLNFWSDNIIYFVDLSPENTYFFHSLATCFCLLSNIFFIWSLMHICYNWLSFVLNLTYHEDMRRSIKLFYRILATIGVVIMFIGTILSCFFYVSKSDL